jgi:hypothetical protein
LDLPVEKCLRILQVVIGLTQARAEHLHESVETLISI